MSLDRALKALKSLGLTDTDAQVYVYLAKKGPHEGNDLADALKLPKNQLSLCLESLATRGMVSTFPENSSRYFAVPLEKVLDDFVKAATEKAKALQASKEEILSTWSYEKRKDSSNS